MMYHEHSDFGRLFTLSYLLANKRQRRWMTAAYVGIPLCACVILFWVCHPYHAETNQYPSVYPVVGSESKQVWTLKEDSFVDLVNGSLSDTAPSLTYLHEPKWYNAQRMLSLNGETWLITFDVVPNTAVDSSLWRKHIPDIAEYLGNVTGVKLSLYQDETRDWSVNQQYVKALVAIFNPGAEDYVIDKLHLGGNVKNASKVKVGNVLYTYASTGPALIIEPDT